MASASSLAQFQVGGERGMETIEIDPQFASGLGFAQGDIVSVAYPPSKLVLHVTQVEIGLLHDLGYATTVEAEPLTVDDWEILVRFILKQSTYGSSVSQRNCTPDMSRERSFRRSG